MTGQENSGLNALFGWEPVRRPRDRKGRFVSWLDYYLHHAGPAARACYGLFLKMRLTEMEGTQCQRA